MSTAIKGNKVDVSAEIHPKSTGVNLETRLDVNEVSNSFSGNGAVWTCPTTVGLPSQNYRIIRTPE